ncbi:MAG: alanine racemase [candidate division WOR-3 bacterium]|nr:alanine racemase [candidate division WOR-3 bacterium]
MMDSESTEKPKRSLRKRPESLGTTLCDDSKQFAPAKSHSNQSLHLTPKNKLQPTEGKRIWAEIDLNALQENLASVKKVLGNKKILLAIKADAYGHGAKEIAAQLDAKVDMFGVAGIEEGINLRTNGKITAPILILSPIPYYEIDALFNHNLTPSITEIEFARRLALEAKKQAKPIKVHIEVDTGMGRTGLPYEEAADTIVELNSNPYLKVEGVFTHFPAADVDFSFTNQQIEKYSSLIESLNQVGVKPIIRHVANSAGFLNFSASHFDMIRPGLVIYGINPNSATSQTISLNPVMSLRSRIVNLRKIPKGQSISYERTYFTKRDSLIAVITAGYGDGYPWSLSNNAEVLVSEDRAKVVGNVCMDLTMIDVTDIPNVKIGDVVTLMGSSGKETISANDLANWAKTIPYEIITRISPRVPRVFIQDQTVLRVRDLLNL